MGLETDATYRGNGMPLAYGQVKGLVEAQKAQGAHIDIKASTMFAVTTALVGIAVPFVLSQFGSGKDFQHRETLLWAASIPIIFYLLVAYLFWRIYQLKEYSDVNDPYEVKKIIQRTPEAAYESLYKQVEQAYSDNKKINEGKVRNFQCLLLAVVFQTMITVAWSFFVVLFSLRT